MRGGDRSPAGDRSTLARLRAQRVRGSTDPTAAVDLADGLARLAPERRDAFVLTAMAGLSYVEAAKMCGCPVGTIRSRVARARADLIDAFWPSEGCNHA